MLIEPVKASKPACVQSVPGILYVMWFRISGLRLQLCQGSMTLKLYTLLRARWRAGAQNDLERVTKMAYAQVAVYGMNEKVRQPGALTLVLSSHKWGRTLWGTLAACFGLELCAVCSARQWSYSDLHSAFCNHMW